MKAAGCGRLNQFSGQSSDRIRVPLGKDIAPENDDEMMVLLEWSDPPSGATH